ncbi:MAG: SEC-C domain-containing protein [Elusimicrobia bacterium]|nr:SEC-C domain-containing protein [Elusimicrobiota bacterium]
MDKENLDLASRPGQVFCYALKADTAGHETCWEPVPTYRPTPANPVSLDSGRLSKLKSNRLKADGVWEADAFHLPSAIMGPDRPELPCASMVVHQESFFIIHTDLSGPDKPKHQALAEAVLEAIEKSGRLPREIQVRGEELAKLLSPLGEGLGLKVSAKERLEAILDVKDSMEDFLGRRHRKEAPEKRLDHRAMEKISFNLSRHLEDQKFESPEEMSRFLHESQEKGELDKTPAPRSAGEAAQNLMYQAFEEPSVLRRIKLARRALQISPDCADAYNLLAEETAGSLVEARDLYLKAVEAGERGLGKEFFKEHAGHFWGIVESRPYMRARAELARCLWLLGDREAAFSHWREMLKLNPNDNQGMRHVLLARLGELGRFEEIREIVSRYKDDCSLEFLLMKALAAFAFKAPPAESAGTLREALEYNEYFPDYLLKRKRLPRRFADRLQLGGETEATYAVSEVMPAWEKVPGAFEWLAGELAKLDLPKVGRNEPCPCGSGKKYKKCCAP